MYNNNVKSVCRKRVRLYKKQLVQLEHIRQDTQREKAKLEEQLKEVNKLVVKQSQVTTNLENALEGVSLEGMEVSIEDRCFGEGFQESVAQVSGLISRVYRIFETAHLEGVNFLLKDVIFNVLRLQLFPGRI